MKPASAMRTVFPLIPASRPKSLGERPWLIRISMRRRRGGFLVSTTDDMIRTVSQRSVLYQGVAQRPAGLRQISHPVSISPSDKKRRAEVARAFAEIGNQDELGERIGFKPPRLRRYLNSLTGELSEVDLLRIAEVCGVPRWFVLHGWNGWREIPGVEGGESDDVPIRPRDLIPPEDQAGPGDADET